jgi:hypothetical protein
MTRFCFAVSVAGSGNRLVCRVRIVVQQLKRTYQHRSSKASQASKRQQESMRCRSQPKTSWDVCNMRKDRTTTSSQHCQPLGAPYGEHRQSSASKLPMIKVACAASCALDVCTMLSSDNRQPTQIALTKDKHPGPFKYIMRDTSHLKTGRSRLVGISAAGQLFWGERGLRSIPGRFIVASVVSGADGVILTVRSEEDLVYGRKRVMASNCGL